MAVLVLVISPSVSRQRANARCCFISRASPYTAQASASLAREESLERGDAYNTNVPYSGKSLNSLSRDKRDNPFQRLIYRRLDSRD